MKTLLVHSILFVGFIIFPLFRVPAQWIHSNGPYGGTAHSLAISGNNLFLCVDGNIYRSTDNGSYWNSINANITANFIIANGANIFAGTGGGGVYLSNDNGANWRAVNNGLPSILPELNVSSLAVIGTCLFASIRSPVVRQPGLGVFRSSDNGSNWFSSNIGLGSADANVFASGQNGTGNTDIFVGTSNGVFRSTNNGGSWISIGLEKTNISALAINSNGTGGINIFAGTWSNGLFLSTDRGSHWSAVNSGIADTYISALAINSNNSGGINLFTGNGANIFVGTQEGNVYLSSNNGASWSAVNTGLISGSFDWGAGIFSLTVNGSNIFACTLAGLFLSTDNGLNWKPMNNGIQSITVNAIAVDSNIAGNTSVFAGTFPSGVFLSTDNGTNWTAVNNGIRSVNISALTVIGRNIFAGSSDGVFRSTNNGVSWNDGGLDGSYVVKLLSASDQAGDTVIFAGTWSGTFLSTDYGNNWVTYPVAIPATSANVVALANAFYYSSNVGAGWNLTELPRTTNTWIGCVIAVSPNSGGDTDIIVGTSDEGVLISTNNGTAWNSFNTGMPSAYGIYSLAASGPYLLAGINLSGVWKRLLSEVTSVQKTPPNQIPQLFSLSQNYPNPFNPSTTISYQIASASKVSLKVYDLLGREIATLVDETKLAGNYTATFRAANLPSGVYFYRLQAGTFTQTKKLVLLK